MLQILKLSLVVLTALNVVACDQANHSQLTESEMSETLQLDSVFEKIEWTELIPQHDLDSLLNPPNYDDIQDGSTDDQIASQLKSSISPDTQDPYQKALVSTDVIAEMNGRGIRIPGFVVPLEFNDDEAITQFFLVPFFGACFHLPPPPPNQIILIDYPKGFDLESVYAPIWVSGTLGTTLTENEVAISAYSMQMESFDVYTEE